VTDHSELPQLTSSRQHGYIPAAHPSHSVSVSRTAVAASSPSSITHLPVACGSSWSVHPGHDPLECAAPQFGVIEQSLHNYHFRHGTLHGSTGCHHRLLLVVMPLRTSVVYRVPDQEGSAWGTLGEDGMITDRWRGIWRV
jgi:hypothetical protein